MGIGFIWLYISIVILAVAGAILLWFTTKNIWACVAIVGLFGILAGIIALSTAFANKSDMNTVSIALSDILDNYI